MTLAVLLGTQHPHQQIGIALLVGGLMAFGVAWFLDRRRRSYADTPTTPAAAVARFIVLPEPNLFAAEGLDLEIR